MKPCEPNHWASSPWGLLADTAREILRDGERRTWCGALLLAARKLGLRKSEAPQCDLPEGRR